MNSLSFVNNKIRKVEFDQNREHAPLNVFLKLRYMSAFNYDRLKIFYTTFVKLVFDVGQNKL